MLILIVAQNNYLSFLPFYFSEKKKKNTEIYNKLKWSDM